MRVLTAEGYKPADNKEMTIRAGFTREKQFLHLADHIIALSKRTALLIESDYGATPRKISLIYNGINDSKEKLDSFNSKKERILLFVGRLDEIKGLNYLISAFSLVVEKHCDTKLLIIGDGDFQSHLKESLEDLAMITDLDLT